MADNLTIKDAAGTNRIIRATESGSIYTPHHVVEQMDNLYEVTLSLDTNAYASGDLLADTQSLDANAFIANGGKLLVQNIHIIDLDDNGGALDIVLLRSNTSLGTENNAVSIIGDNAAEIILVKPIYTTDYIDIGNFKWAAVQVCEVIKADASSTALYIGAISRDTMTYSAAGLVVRVGVLGRTS